MTHYSQPIKNEESCNEKCGNCLWHNESLKIYSVYIFFWALKLYKVYYYNLDFSDWTVVQCEHKAVTY